MGIHYSSKNCLRENRDKEHNSIGETSQNRNFKLCLKFFYDKKCANQNPKILSTSIPKYLPINNDPFPDKSIFFIIQTQ